MIQQRVSRVAVERFLDQCRTIGVPDRNLLLQRLAVMEGARKGGTEYFFLTDIATVLCEGFHDLASDVLTIDWMPYNTAPRSPVLRPEESMAEG